MDINTVAITGNLCEAPRIQQYNDAQGRSRDFAIIRLASNTRQRDYKRTDYFSIAVFNEHLVDLMRNHGGKGQKVRVECQLAQHVTGSGQDRKDELRLRITAFKGDILLLQSPKRRDDRQSAAQESAGEQPEHDPYDDEIPF